MVSWDTVEALRREAEQSGVVVHQVDGTRRFFDWMEVMAQLYLWRLAVTGGYELPPSDVLDAYHRATPGSREMLEAMAASVTGALDDLEDLDSTELKEVEDLSEP